MIIKENFTLLKGVPNILRLSKKEIDDYSIDRGTRKFFVVLDLNQQRINHYTKDHVYSIISDLEKRKQIAVVNLPNYNLHTSYNVPTKQIILNISPFNVDDIYANDPPINNLYAQLVYGLCFSRLVTDKIIIKESFYEPISSFLFSMFMRLFGKEYGLLGSHSTNINKLHFLINCYILSAFFGIEKTSLYRTAAKTSMYDYSEIKNELENFDFSTIDNFIKYLSYFKVFPGINIYSFTSKVMRMTSTAFLPALEDFSRFISIFTCISLKGSNVIPTFISTYNEKSFEKIIQISKLVFK